MKEFSHVYKSEYQNVLNTYNIPNIVQSIEVEGKEGWYTIELITDKGLNFKPRNNLRIIKY